MTNKECIMRIFKLVEELHIAHVTREEFLESLKDATFNEISDEIWNYYCFVCDVICALMEVKE